MDVVTTLRSEIFRPAATIIAPGATGALPYFFVVTHYFPVVHEFAKHHELVFLFTAVIITIAFGLISEDFGSIVEAKVLDPMLKKNDPQFMNDWYKYLRLTFPEEPVGHRYLRTLTLRLKFELNFSVSLIFLWLGLFWLESVNGFLSTCAFVLFTVGITVSVVYLLWESRNSAANLARVRKEVLKGVNSANKR